MLGCTSLCKDFEISKYNRHPRRHLCTSLSGQNKKEKYMHPYAPMWLYFPMWGERKKEVQTTMHCSIYDSFLCGSLAIECRWSAFGPWILWITEEPWISPWKELCGSCLSTDLSTALGNCVAVTHKIHSPDYYLVFLNNNYFY